MILDGTRDGWRRKTRRGKETKRRRHTGRERKHRSTGGLWRNERKKRREGDDG